LTISYSPSDIKRLNKWRNFHRIDTDGDPVSLISGNFFWDHVDISLSGAQKLEFMRHYNSLDDSGGEMGVGWRHNYMYTIEKSLLFATLTLPNGYSLLYKIMGDGSYIGPEGRDYYLESYGDGYLMTDQAQTKYIFDSDGFVLSIEDIGGRLTAIERNGVEIISISNSCGEFWFTYENGKIVKITDNTGRSIHYSYNGDKLISYKNINGDSIDFVYGERGLTEISDFNGNTYLKNTYDDDRRVISQFIMDQGVTQYSYDTLNRVSTIKLPDGAERKYYYDYADDLLVMEDAKGKVRYEYENGRISKTIDRLDNETRYSYDEFGNTTCIEYPDKKTELFEYNSLNLVTKMTQRDNTTIEANYDSSGNITQLINARGKTYEFTYDGEGNRLSEKDPLGNYTFYTYDKKGNILSKEDPLHNFNYYEYNEQGFITKHIYPN
jgi:YD repeat-containing protein